MIFSDWYRMIAFMLDWRRHLRVMSGKGKYEVAFISNFEHDDLQKQFPRKKKEIAYCLRFYVGKSLCRNLLINCSVQELARPKSRLLAKQYTQVAITTAVRDGARILLFSADIKRLFSENELVEIQRNHPGVIFTTGDNGTALALLEDVLHAIRLRGLNASSRIAILGSNGFLGEVTATFLRKLGYNNLLLLHSNMESPFAHLSQVELIIACSHYVRLQLTREILDRISCEGGTYVIDICRPGNFSRQEFMKCQNIVRQDSGMVRNTGIKYVFPWGRLFVLRRFGIFTRIMDGCVAEAVALSLLPQQDLKNIDFLNGNTEAMQFMEQAFTRAGFTVSPVHNFGRPTGTATSAAGWNVAKYL
jgi:predicted amino acid dehydrogenase